jgi:signal transduction histidine kinase
MNLAAILRDRGGLSETAERLAEESLQLVRQVSAEIRTLSHLLHPPLLDEVGLKSALSEYVGGFSQRSGIEAKLQMADDCERLPRDCELSLFRIVQESLTNIHRHSGSATALVRLRRGPKEIRLEVIDEGKGIDREIQEEFLMGRSSGVGLRGMRERVRQIGGTLDILSDERGTAVVAVLPIRKEKQAREVSG